MREEDLYDMSDEELEAAFKAAKAEEASPETEIEEESNPVVDDSDTEETEEFDSSDEELDENGSEHPEDDQDSDHDASVDESDDDEPAEETETEEEGDPDEEPETEEEETAEGEESEEEDAQPVQSYKFKANGKEYEFTREEMEEQFPRIFGQAMDYTRKMQTIKPWRKTIDALEQAKLSHEDINLAIDVLKGDKDAIAEVLKRTGTDTLDLNVDESNYVAKDYGRDDTTLAIKDVIDSISKDPEFATTHNILEKGWDDASWKALSSDPEKIRLLHVDVKSGMYDRLQPLAEKLKVYDGGKKSDLDYYIQAAQNYYRQQEEREAYEAEQQRILAENKARQEARQKDQERLDSVKAKSVARDATKKASVKRKAAAPTSNGLGKPDVVDYLNSTDEDFEDWYKNLQEEM